MKPVTLHHDSFHIEDNGGGLRYTVSYTVNGPVYLRKVEAIVFENPDEPKAEPEVKIDITWQMKMMEVMIETVTDWDAVYKIHLESTKPQPLPFHS